MVACVHQGKRSDLEHVKTHQEGNMPHRKYARERGKIHAYIVEKLKIPNPRRQNVRQRGTPRS